MNSEAARSEMLALMGELEDKPLHVRHVARLALQLFDELAALHGLGPRERLLLEAAACLHDIGHHENPALEGHHKESARLIREHPWQHFPAADVQVIAQVARYHRKTMPEMSHEEFALLPETERRVVLYLAALLRLADAFDRSHLQHVVGVTVRTLPNQIVFRLEASGHVQREITAAHKKGDLATAVFQRDLVFQLADDADGASADSPPA